MPSLRSGVVTGFICLAVALVACSSSPAAVSSEEETPQEEGNFPITVNNCGFDVHLEDPPERIVTIKSTSTELVLALGLGENLVGHAFPDGDLPEKLTMPAPAPPLLSDKTPTKEAILGVEPDVVFGGWESNFTQETSGEREALADLGIATYVAPPACQDEAYQPNPLTFDHIFDYILQVGQLLGASEQAQELISEQRDTKAAITPDERGLTSLWYSSGSDIPFVGGGIGAPQLLMETVGLDNINAEVDDTWASVSWEAIVAQDPDVIVLVDSAWNTVENKISVLENNPMTAEMSAVQNSRYLTVDFPASEAGVRSVDAALSLANQLADLE